MNRWMGEPQNRSGRLERRKVPCPCRDSNAQPRILLTQYFLMHTAVGHHRSVRTRITTPRRFVQPCQFLEL